MSYTLADLERITGVKRRSLQLWSDARVIEAAPDSMLAGKGVHRRFDRDETIIACLLAGYSKMNMSIGALKEVAFGLRGSLGPPLNLRECVENVIAGKAKGYVVMSRGRDFGWGLGIVSERKDPATKRALGVQVFTHARPGQMCTVLPIEDYVKGLAD